MTRVKEALNLVYHGTKERDKPGLFSDVAEWLAAMCDHECATAVAAKRAASLASELAAVNGPCDCQEACCAHWRSEAAIILTAALRAPATTAAPRVADDLLRNAGAIIIVSEGDAGARVEIRFAELQDAQRLHKTLAQMRAAAATPAPVEQKVYVSEHPVTLHCNTCGLVQVKSFKCPRCDGQLVAGASPVDQKIDEATMEWALRELADGWITNNEREGPHGFYQNARRVLEAIVS